MHYHRPRWRSANSGSAIRRAAIEETWRGERGTTGACGGGGGGMCKRVEWWWRSLLGSGGSHFSADIMVTRSVMGSLGNGTEMVNIRQMEGKGSILLGNVFQWKNDINQISLTCKCYVNVVNGITILRNACLNKNNLCLCRINMVLLVKS